MIDEVPSTRDAKRYDRREMTQPIDYLTSINPLGPNNRKSTLLVWGIVLIVLGAGAGCLSLTVPLALLAPRAAGATPSMPLAQLMTAVGMYVSLSVALIWLGIGSIRCRRWSRPIVLVLCVLCLICGILGTIFAAITVPQTTRIMSTTGPAATPVPAAAAAVGYVAGFACLGIFVLAIPAMLIWFYKDPAVRATVEYYDPESRWTDRCPLPVLGASITLALSGLWTLPTAVSFASIRSGAIPALVITLVTLVIGAMHCLAAWWMYRLRVVGWWLGVATAVMLFAWMIVLWYTVDLREIYRPIAVSGPQVDQLVDLGVRQRPIWIATASIVLVSALGYAAYIRRFFTLSDPAESNLPHEFPPP
jgi:hypothetical protein